MLNQRHLAALMAAAALAASSTTWAEYGESPSNENGSGDSGYDASPHHASHYGTNGQYAGNPHGAYQGDGSNGSGDPEILKHGTGASHVALLAGGHEVSKDGKADAGDADGKGAAALSVDPEAGKLCFGIVVNNIDGPVAAHIHQGKAGRNGPVVIPLKAPESGNPGAVSGCIDHVDRALLHAIHAHPWAYYVNVHTGEYPEGAVRGQIH